MVLTDEQQSDAYSGASMETAQATTEESFYTNLSQSRSDKPPGYPNDTYTNPNVKVAKLRGDAQKIGPGIMLKVMAGDKFNLRVSSWYKLNGVTPAAPYNPIGDLVYMLAWSAPGVGSKSTMQELQNSGVLTPGATSFVNTQNGYNTSRPKAFVNWVLLDEQFKFVSSSSGSEQVPAESAFGTVPNQIVYPHVRTALPIDKSGYLYVYVSNETPNIDVFFDNLQVTHVRGPMVEETHYYPFGLTQSGISSKALAFGNPKNKETTFQGQRFDDELDVNWVQFKWRNHDPQIGRFIEIDPLSEKYEYNSTYAFSENKVINGVELEGLEVVLINKNKDKTIFNAARSDNRIINVYAHGSQHSITDNSEGTDSGKRITSADEFNKMLSKSDEKEKWEEKTAKDPAIVVLHSCRTGRPITKNGKVVGEPIASKFSKIKNTIVVAPDERDYFKDGLFSDYEMGPYKNSNTDENGNYTKMDEKKNEPDSERTGEKGNWKMFVNGKELGTFNGKIPSLNEILNLYNQTLNDEKKNK